MAPREASAGCEKDGELPRFGREMEGLIGGLGCFVGLSLFLRALWCFFSWWCLLVKLGLGVFYRGFATAQERGGFALRCLPGQAFATPRKPKALVPPRVG